MRLLAREPSCSAVEVIETVSNESGDSEAASWQARARKARIGIPAEKVRMDGMSEEILRRASRSDRALNVSRETAYSKWRHFIAIRLRRDSERRFVFRMASFNLMINGDSRAVEAEPEMPLLWVLRDILEMTGTKYGCGVGQCGCCTVLLNGMAARSCQLPVGSIEEMEVTTIEGLSEAGEHPVQLAWREENTAQCGYCQAGQIMSAVSLLRKNAHPNEQDIDSAMSGNLCRCGTYKRIRKSIHRAAAKLEGKAR